MSIQDRDKKLIIFVKAPQHGRVKTRLAATIGAKEAAAVYKTLVRQLLSNLEPLTQPVELRFSPDDALAEIEPWLRPGWEIQPQGDGDLGQRLVSAFADAFDQGFKSVAIIGSDCPFVSPQEVEMAWAALGSHDLVLGPAHDGGYWLVALNRLHPELFEGIPWSTGDVLQKTRDHAAQLQLTLRELQFLPDIDTESDWREYLQRVAKAYPADPMSP